MKHYILINSWAHYGCEGRGVLGVAHTKEELSAMLDKAIVSETEFAEENDWEIEENLADGYVFKAYRNDEYYEGHSILLVEEYDTEDPDCPFCKTNDMDTCSTDTYEDDGKSLQIQYSNANLSMMFLGFADIADYSRLHRPINYCPMCGRRLREELIQIKELNKGEEA